MAHVSSRSFQDPDGIFLYQMDERGNRIRRIGGPYPSSEAADEASRAVSAEMGERPVEGYTERLRQTNPGVIGGQSPIPEQYRQYNAPGQPGLLDEPKKKEEEKGTWGSVLDWLIPTAEKSETTGFLSSDQSGLLSTDALQGFGEFLHETYRYGNPPPTLKLGMLKYPDAAHVVDLGLDKRHRISGVRGRAGLADTGSTTGEILEIIADPDTGRGYDSLRKYYDDQKKKGYIREGISYEDWAKTAKPLSEGERYVSLPAQAKNPLRPTVWSHEFSHLGQIDLRDKKVGGTREARQRMTDIMYPSFRHPEEIESDIKWLEKEGFEVGGEAWMQLYENTQLEHKYANEELKAMGKTPGGTSNLQLLTDWLEGGRTKEGYNEVIKKRRKENLPGLLGVWNKTIGLFD